MEFFKIFTCQFSEVSEFFLLIQFIFVCPPFNLLLAQEYLNAAGSLQNLVLLDMYCEEVPLVSNLKCDHAKFLPFFALNFKI